MENTNSSSMSEPSSLINIFFEPGRTFSWLREHPKFILALVLIFISVLAFQLLFFQRMGDDRMRRFVVEQLEKNPQIAAMEPEQKKQTIELQVTISTIIGKYLVPVFMIVFFAIGTLLYWLGTKAMGGEMSFMQGLSVWFYSSFPPIVISTLANILILFLKSPDDIDIATSQAGLLKANPGMFMDGKEMPVLTTLISTIDLFSIWGWILAAIGLRTIGRLSSGAAWGVVIIVALIGITFRVLNALISGNPS